MTSSSFLGVSRLMMENRLTSQPVCTRQMLNDELATGSLKVFAEEEQIAVDRQEALHMSDAELISEITSGLKTLSQRYSIELGLQTSADLGVYANRRVCDPTVDALQQSVTQKWGPCWGIPEGQCKE
jgi:hypothetical protein